MPTHNSILLFADRLPPLVGGMEMHGGYFIEHFEHHPLYPLAGTVTRDSAGQNWVIHPRRRSSIVLPDLPHLFNPRFVFFNSGRWIEDLDRLRALFPHALFIYRTGGNEILKAPLEHIHLPDHRLRQEYWAKVLNHSLDLLITNSAYTERRLRDIGIACPFKRFVGGVNAEALKLTIPSVNRPCTLFCAARFVPYKNHMLLASTLLELAQRGCDFRVRLAGDGPLLASMQQYVVQNNLSPLVTFLGALDNRRNCQEIAQADLYIQLSCDQLTTVPGGSYVHAEGMGRSILEAISAGTFVIAGQSGALAEIITFEKGVLVDLASNLADSIEPLINNPPPKNPFNDQFDWKKLFSNYENEIFAHHRKI